MSDREPTQRPGGRSGMSVSGTLSIIVAAVAVILGFLILRDINDTGDSSGGGGGGGTVTTSSLPGGPDNTEPDDAATTTTAPATLKPYTVLVANAAKVGGAAGALTTALKGAGVAVVEPGVNSSVTAAESTTTIFYLPTYEAEAADLARIMGVTATAAMPEPPPLESGKALGTAQLLVQLGTDKANQPLPAGTGGAATTTTVATATT